MLHNYMKLRVIGVSSGLGVSLYPFKKYLLGNYEPRGVFHTKADEQWRANFAGIPLWRTWSSFRAGCAKQDKKPNVIISSPDCGSGSIFRLSRAKKYGDHKKNQSLLNFFEAVKEYKPQFFLFENLENLFKSFPEKEFDQVLKRYFLVKHIVPVTVFGNSQKNRVRLVIVGVRKTLGHDLTYWQQIFKIPKTLESIRNCRQLYGDLEGFNNPETGCIREPLSTVISIHARRRMSLLDIKTEWLTRLSGEKRWSSPGYSFSTAPGVYRNLDNDFPATARKANRQFDHFGLTLTPRHLARVQGVPDDFKIHIDPKRAQYWINKGRTTVTKTPPYEISLWFKSRLFKYLKSIK